VLDITVCLTLQRAVAMQCFVLLVSLSPSHISRLGQIRMHTPYMTVYLAISLRKIPCIHRMYTVLANPTHISGARACSVPFKLSNDMP